MNTPENYRPASQEEQARIDDLHQQAVDLWDNGYHKIDADYPGWVRPWSISDDRPPLEVPMEIWFFIRGGFFGIGDSIKREEKRNAH